MGNGVLVSLAFLWKRDILKGKTQSLRLRLPAGARRAGGRRVFGDRDAVGPGEVCGVRLGMHALELRGGAAGRKGDVRCPCHTSRFDREGQLIDGEAQEDLLRVEIEIQAATAVERRSWGRIKKDRS